MGWGRAGSGTVVLIGMRDEPAVAEAGMMLQQPEVLRVFSQELVPESPDPGSGRLHRLPGWGAGSRARVNVTCACTQDSWWLQQQC